MKEIKMRTLTILLAVFFAILFFAAFDALAANIASELQATLRTAAPDKDVPVIITFSNKVDTRIFAAMARGLRRSKMIKALRERAAANSAPLVAFLQNRGAKRLLPLWIINGVAVTVPAGMINSIVSLPGVEEIRLDGVIHAPVTKSGTTATAEWNINVIKASDIWNIGYTGTGVVVAGMDTGVDANHPDLQGRWRGGSNSWFDPNAEHPTPYDADGHGTQVMGIMVGGNAGGSSVGVAPGAKWIAVKIYNDADVTSFSIIHEGFQWLLDPDNNPDTNDAPDVVNNSWGIESADTCSPEFVTDIQTLEAAGMSLVFSAGNYGPHPSTSISPANNAGSFAAGATDNKNAIASFSSRGPSACDGGLFPAAVAPGQNVRTTDLTYGGAFPGSYATVSGTSYAAPHVSGIMALLIGAFPGASVQDLKRALQTSATDLGTAGADNDYGNGLINGMAAYNYLVSLLGAPTAPPSPPPMQTPVQWNGPVSFFLKITSTSTDASGRRKFGATTQKFNGTVSLTTQDGELVADAGGCFVKMVSDDGKTICIKDKSLITTFDPKSKSDSLLMTGQGIFSEPANPGIGAGPVYLDTKGTLKKDFSGNLTSISLKGKVAGGIDDGFVLSGNFNSRLVPAF
jgi:subtilisin family serine protease